MSPASMASQRTSSLQCRLRFFEWSRGEIDGMKQQREANVCCLSVIVEHGVKRQIDDKQWLEECTSLKGSVKDETMCIHIKMPTRRGSTYLYDASIELQLCRLVVMLIFMNGTIESTLTLTSNWSYRWPVKMFFVRSMLLLTFHLRKVARLADLTTHPVSVNNRWCGRQHWFVFMTASSSKLRNVDRSNHRSWSHHFFNMTAIHTNDGWDEKFWSYTFVIKRTPISTPEMWLWDLPCIFQQPIMRNCNLKLVYEVQSLSSLFSNHASTQHDRIRVSSTSTTIPMRIYRNRIMLSRTGSSRKSSTTTNTACLSQNTDQQDN